MPNAEMPEFTLDEARVDEVAGQYEIADEQEAADAIDEALLLGSAEDLLLGGPCPVEIQLTADLNGQINGYRVLLDPDPDAPMITGGQRNAPLDAGPAGIFRDFVQAANELWQMYRETAAPVFTTEELILLGNALNDYSAEARDHEDRWPETQWNLLQEVQRKIAAATVGR